MRLSILALVTALPTVTAAHHQCDRAVELMDRALVEMGEFSAEEFEAATQTPATLFLLSSSIYLADAILVRDRILQQRDVADPLALRFVAGGEIVDCSRREGGVVEQADRLDAEMPQPLRQLMRDYVLENYREPT